MKKQPQDSTTLFMFYDHDFELLRSSRRSFLKALFTMLLFGACVAVLLSGEIGQLLSLAEHTWQHAIVELLSIALDLALVAVVSRKAERLWQTLCLYAQEEAWTQYSIEPRLPLLMEDEPFFLSDGLGLLACVVFWVVQLFPRVSILWRIPQFIAAAYLLFSLTILLATIAAWHTMLRALRQRLPIIVVMDDQPK